MERYLSFELSDDDVQRSDLVAYKLGSTNLLPKYFGGVSSINIFLGENNSGKSRFMRAIMKRSSIRNILFDSNIETTLDRIKSALVIILTQDVSVIYDLMVNIQPAAVDNPFLKDVLSYEMEYTAGVNRLEISARDRIIEISKMLENIVERLSSIEKLIETLSSNEIDEYISNIKICLKSLKRAKNIYHALRNRSLRSYSLELRSISNNLATYSGHYVELIFKAGSQASYFNSTQYTNELSEKVLVILNVVINLCDAIPEFLEILNQDEAQNIDRTYIPTLRTARTLITSQGGYGNDDSLKATTVKDYELAECNVQVHTGLSLFNAIDEKKNSDIEDREAFKSFQDFLSQTFFNGSPVEVVPNRKNYNILVAVGKEERALPHLGDGIQAIILLLYPLFIAPEGAWFFVEEPEIHLHPGFQRLFIKTISTHPVLLNKKLTIFLTTHSNHLLDFALDDAKNISLFTFRKTLNEVGKASYQVQLSAPHDLECLNALGVQNSSVFLSNCTIWVEGITDRIYLKAYLKIYLEYRKQTFSLLEGLHYSFLEYAGANVSHYAFDTKPQQVKVTDEALRDIQALSISNRIMLIADQDAGKDTKHQRLTSQQHAGFEYVVLPTREIENLLTPDVIVGALKKLYSKQAYNFDAEQLKQGQYKTAYLARHLQGKFSDLPASFVADSGTIASAKKRQFAEAAAEVITSWDMLSDDAKALTEQVFKFIMGHNPRLGSN